MTRHSSPPPLSRALLPVGYGASWHRVLIDQALTGLPAALLVEVGWSSRSRLPGWGGTALRRRYGTRYLPLGHLLGNMTYREPGQIRTAARSARPSRPPIPR
ncbi:hypothetical protein [Thermogemmatispora carboxidivorans]|uniref:hypothetical protein n=1 Tax=Thermogemmatispora carboxidivorans TaxID=1382306 RepID=UPI0012DDC558|nr:hypothetical protein [Thermogemmatispora carboxidivorans]